ncbi:MAG: cyclic nucleotide-binding domain-containing protein, partial [Lysinibacillus sp.]
MQQLQQFVKACGKKVTFHQSKVIFQAGEAPTHFYLLEEGYVKVFQEAENGQVITLSFFKRGDFFGLAELFANYSVHECSATTLQGATFYAISMAELQQRLLQD